MRGPRAPRASTTRSTSSSPRASPTSATTSSGCGPRAVTWRTSPRSASRAPRPRLRRSRRCAEASTSSTRRPSSTGTGSGSPTSCCASTCPRASAASFGGWRYDIADTKLARRLKVPALLQMATYAARLETLQGVPPQWLTVVTGDQEQHPWRLVDVAPYARRRRAELLDAIASPRETESARVQHCGQCRWKERCAQEWLDRDDLIQVAGMRSDHRAALIDLGIPTLRALAESSEDELAGALSRRDPSPAAPAGSSPARRATRPVSPSSSCSPPSRGAVCRCCPSPTRATSTSTSRATPGPRAAPGASTSPASGPGRASSSSSGRTTSRRRVG